jgi:hypothetical protein
MQTTEKIARKKMQTTSATITIISRSNVAVAFANASVTNSAWSPHSRSYVGRKIHRAPLPRALLNRYIAFAPRDAYSVLRAERPYESTYGRSSRSEGASNAPSK